MSALSIFWFRRDLRLDDNAGLYEALRSGRPVLPLFIFDTNILGRLEDSADRRVSYIHASLVSLQRELRRLGSDLLVETGPPAMVFEKLIGNYPVEAVFTNNDYEPYARRRDEEIRNLLASKGIMFTTCKDHVIFEKDEVLKDSGQPYTVFTPYSRKWKELLADKMIRPYASETLSTNFWPFQHAAVPSLESIGFTKAPLDVGELREDVLRNYENTRDYPAQDGTSRVGVQLRFGTLSIRKLAMLAMQQNLTFLNELIWRDFFQMIIWHFPHVAKEPFRKEFESIKWRNNEEEFEAWCRGCTGFPLVDAGMRQLNATGFMHNRVRMVVASFLSKLLLVDWRLGEAYFAAKLLDYELASNNGNWQWAAGSGCDAVPYFRIFNPALQEKKFDPQQHYIKQWVPEIGTSAYPQPIIDYKEARQRALKVYSEALRRDK